MKTYIGTKIIQAEPAYRVSNDHAHHIIVTDPADAYANYPDVEEGYRVRYQDGYESWSPKAAFEEAYRLTDGVNFGLALEAMKKGMGARLPHWKPDVVIRVQYPDEHSKMTVPYLYVESRYGRVPWKETMIELFSDDWVIVE